MNSLFDDIYEANLNTRYPGRDAYRQMCNAEGCSRPFDDKVQGLACSKCKMAFYCNAQCQKVAWKLHRPRCRNIEEMKKAFDPNLPLKDRRPNMIQDGIHFTSLIDYAIVMMARSAMRIGRPDSLAKDHWFHFELTYLTPPVERWSKTTTKPYGDEHKLFRLYRVRVRPDRELDVALPGNVTSAEKKRRSGAMAEKSPDCSIVYIVINTLASDRLEGPESNIAMYFTIPHQVGLFENPFSKRKLNPMYQMLIPLAIQSPPKDEEEAAEHRRYLRLIDHAMSEKLEDLEYSLFMDQPDEGWRRMFRKVFALKCLILMAGMRVARQAQLGGSQ